jgi:glycosyltransferase involved in cell wall biosynthesis
MELKMVIYYITRSYYPTVTGGTIIRKMQVDGLVKKFNVKIVTLEKGSSADNVIEIENSRNSRLAMLQQRLGLSEDYLDHWVNKAFEVLKNIITSDDVIFSTSGGEIGCLKLGALLKKRIGCKLVFNLHDPINYSLVNGIKRDRKFHASREAVEKKYLEICDEIITSSKSYQSSLIKKYPKLERKIECSYFGYVKKINKLAHNLDSKKLKIVYAGNMGRLQSPEILIFVWNSLPREIKKNVELIFVGNTTQNKAINSFSSKSNIHKLEFMQQDELYKVYADCDFGFVSLVGDYFGACFPSKIFDYIAGGLPILGLLPDGDANDEINKLGVGVSFRFNEIDKLKRLIIDLVNDKNKIIPYRDKVAQNYERWSCLKHQEFITKKIQEL